MKMNSRDVRREFDRMAAQRMRLHSGGVPLHVALGGGPSVSLRFKLKRMGHSLDAPEIEDLLNLVDSMEYQKSMNNMPMSIRYAAVSRPKRERRVWGFKPDDSKPE